MSLADLDDVRVIEAEASDHVRSPVDVLRLVTAAGAVAAIVALELAFGATLVAFAAELFAGLSALPGWVVVALAGATRLLAVLLLAGGLVVVVRDGRWRPLLPVSGAAAGAAALAGALDALDAFGAAPGPGAVAGGVPAPAFPTAPGLAALTAGATAAAPWLARRWRHATWFAVLGLAATRFLALPASFSTLAALLVGWLAGAAAVVACGGPWRRPRGRAVAGGLATMGVPVVQLEQVDVDARGSTPYLGRDAFGSDLFVKVLGDDERSADRLFRLYRRLAPRDFGDERPFTSLRRAVEHEALVGMVARDLGVRTPRLVALARAEPNGFVLAYQAVDGRSLDRLPSRDVSDEVLARIWAQIVELRSHRIAHRDLRLANLFLDGQGQVWVLDFGFSELAASDALLAADLAEVVASSALQVGPRRAVDAARLAVGPEALRAAGRRLRPWALSGATRRALAARHGLLDGIRRRIA